MSGGLINFAAVKPAWLRLLILILIASPLFGRGALHAKVHSTHMFSDLGKWCAYAVFVWILIALCTGVERLMQWLSVAGVLGVTLALTGAVFRHLKVWALLQTLAERLGGDTALAQGELQQTLDLVFRLLVIMISLPYSLFAINSFSAVEGIRKAARTGDRRTFLRVALAVFLRIFQHVFELATTLLTAWREENPSPLLPRFRRDWRKSPVGRIQVVTWARIALWSWAVALLMHAFVFVPVLVRDWERLLDE